MAVHAALIPDLTVGTGLFTTETSAKENVNIESAFQELVEAIVRTKAALAQTMGGSEDVVLTVTPLPAPRSAVAVNLIRAGCFFDADRLKGGRASGLGSQSAEWSL
jgi:hypothetical protein